MKKHRVLMMDILLLGLDFAFSRSGHVYHTKYDREIYMPAGSHQHMGDNTLALLQSLGHAKELFDMQVRNNLFTDLICTVLTRFYFRLTLKAKWYTTIT